jgi:hypothetical protein
MTIFTIESYCRGLGVKVVYEDVPTYGQLDADGMTIRIHKRLSDDSRTIMAAHELGHRFLKHHLNPETNDPVEQLIEEIEAWNWAGSFLKQLYVPLDMKRFKRLRDKCVKSYMIIETR